MTEWPVCLRTCTYTPLADNADRWNSLKSPFFTRQIVALLDDESYAKFQADLALHPSGSLIRGGGGIRKIRVAARSHRKRGGARVIY